MKKEILVLVIIIALIAAIVCILTGIVAIIGSPPITNGCMYRYNSDENGNVTINSDKINDTVNLRADGNYTAVNQLQPDGTNKIGLDPNHYGEWVNTTLSVTNAQQIKVKITGDVSLCRAYIPANNLQSTSALNSSGKRIPIPRIEETNLNPVSLIFDAKMDQWRNITEIYINDKVIVSISPNQKPVKDASGNIIINDNNVGQLDIFTDSVITADCSEGKRQYSPICGRYSMYAGQYVASCYHNPCCSVTCNCHDVCDTFDILGWCTSGWYEVCECCPCWKETYATAPEPYRDDGFYTSPWVSDITTLPLNFNPSCFANYNYIASDAYQKQKYFWFTANTAAGLLYRYDTSESPTNPTSRGGNYAVAQIDPNQGAYNNNPNYQILLNDHYISGGIQYLQYRFASPDGQFANNTGGYTLNIKQTKCRRSNGVPLDDSFAGRGAVQYTIVPFNANPNNPPTGTVYSPTNLSPDVDGNVNINLPSGSRGYMWMRILNNKSDYKDSFGQYLVQLFTSTQNNSFTIDILGPLFDLLKGKVYATSTALFQNMTCYTGGEGDASCTNFFNYVKGLLTLYIMSYGMMFLLGMVQITQTDLVIRVIKIGIVAGLLSQQTFNYFNNYILQFIIGFADQMIANMSGYSLFTSTGNISNPFMFMDSLMSKILFSKTFMVQIMALMSMGITGILFFIIVFVALAILIITALRAIAVYLMAFFAVAILIGLAPLFLTFMLFDFTRYLFDNWVRFTFRYMLEPVILMAGIIILTQLFTIYLDMTIGYSVCWKCALPIKIPFANIPGLSPAFTNVPLFCINWFTAWGLDYRSGSMGINMQHVAALLIIAYCMYGYTDLAGKITVRLTNIGGPSATHMGEAMSAGIGGAIEQAVQGKFGLKKEDREQMQSEAKNREATRKQGTGGPSSGRGSSGKSAARGGGNRGGGGGMPSGGGRK